jgi:hypothetical protein
VTSVAAVPSPAASTHLAFATPYAQVVGTAVAATQCLREVLDAHNATTPWWRSPPWLASRLHQGRCMSAPRPNPSLREGVTPAMLHPRVRHVPATTDRQGGLLREGLVVAALLLAL